MPVDIPGSVKYEVEAGKTHWHVLCWKLSLSGHRGSGQVRGTYYWTEWDLPIRLFDGQEYSPAYGAESTAKQETGAVEPGNKDILGFLTSNTLGLSADDIKRGALRGATLDEYLVDVRTPWVAPIDFKRYFISGSRFDGSVWHFSCEGLAYPMSEQVGEYWGPWCRAELFSTGSGKCEANILAFIGPSFVTTIINQGYQFDMPVSGFFNADGYGLEGKIHFNGGENAGGTYTIKRYTVPAPVSGAGFAEVQLQQRTIRDFTVNDGISVTPGCNHGIRDCEDKFFNIVNFQGEPAIPGSDSVTRGRPTPV